MVLPLQSLLAAVGVGAQRTLPTAAAINWVLKDGLGRLGRLSVATSFGQSFDSDLKVGPGCPAACQKQLASSMLELSLVDQCVSV